MHGSKDDQTAEKQPNLTRVKKQQRSNSDTGPRQSQGLHSSQTGIEDIDQVELETPLVSALDLGNSNLSPREKSPRSNSVPKDDRNRLKTSSELTPSIPVLRLQSPSSASTIKIDTSPRTPVRLKEQTSYIPQSDPSNNKTKRTFQADESIYRNELFPSSTPRLSTNIQRRTLFPVISTKKIYYIHKIFGFIPFPWYKIETSLAGTLPVPSIRMENTLSIKGLDEFFKAVLTGNTEFANGVLSAMEDQNKKNSFITYNFRRLSPLPKDNKPTYESTSLLLESLKGFILEPSNLMINCLTANLNFDGYTALYKTHQNNLFANCIMFNANDEERYVNALAVAFLVSAGGTTYSKRIIDDFTKYLRSQSPKRMFRKDPLDNIVSTIENIAGILSKSNNRASLDQNILLNICNRSANSNFHASNLDAFNKQFTFGTSQTTTSLSSKGSLLCNRFTILFITACIITLSGHIYQMLGCPFNPSGSGCRSM